MKNWLVAAVALALGGAVSAALLIYGNPTRDEMQVFAVAHDLPAGAAITPDSIRLAPVLITDGASSLFTQGDEAQLKGARASHDLIAGQFLQRGDVLPVGGDADMRLVFVPVKDAPPASPGSRLDLLVVGGTADQPTVIPFALGVEVEGAVAGGFVVSVPSRQVSAYVYAAEAMHLVAVIAAPGAAAGAETPVSDPEQAMALASQQ